jgi:hypothetical protein
VKTHASAQHHEVTSSATSEKDEIRHPLASVASAASSLTSSRTAAPSASLALRGICLCQLVCTMDLIADVGSLPTATSSTPFKVFVDASSSPDSVVTTGTMATHPHPCYFVMRTSEQVSISHGEHGIGKRFKCVNLEHAAPNRVREGEREHHSTIKMDRYEGTLLQQCISIGESFDSLNVRYHKRIFQERLCHLQLSLSSWTVIYRTIRFQHIPL